MVKNLVIVESPAKARTIEKYLGKDYTVLSSNGHVRDLSKEKHFGVDIENDFDPFYEIVPEKKALVDKLKSTVKKTETIWLASDKDREGEAIAWHLMKALDIPEEKTQRIVFDEITKQAILSSIQSPRKIDINLINAQQARRILDRLVGFELSPLLWKKVKPKLSAGRVQSVAVRLIVEREKEITAFKTKSNFKVTAKFKIKSDKSGKEIFAELSKRFNTKKDALSFIKSCKDAEFIISAIEKKPSKKSPTAPFTTSTLQQEASRKLGYSVGKTMMIAQQLYEAGSITYMRTDSVNLSNDAHKMAAQAINERFGEKYAKKRVFTTKSKGAQEAHEAIRPTDFSKQKAGASQQQQKLYELIWKRTIASQMSDAQIEKTTVTIDITNRPETFLAKGEVIKFDGFLKVYLESTEEDDEQEVKHMLPVLKKSEMLEPFFIHAAQRFNNHPPRYTEASLVRKLEELGIGRPSTYAPIISTIQKRNYVVIETREGKEREFDFISLENGVVKDEKRTEKTGYEKQKLFPTDTGNLVTQFLLMFFENIMDYNFTANVEGEFDDIAQGAKDWKKMIREFYFPFHEQVEETLKSQEKVKGERLLGKDPKTGENVYVKLGKYGPMAQIGEADKEEKPRFAGLLKTQSIDAITLKEALELFKFPKDIGKYEDHDLVVGVGRFGPYVRHNSKFYSLKKEDDPLTIEQKRAIEIIEEKREKERNKYIKTFKEDPDVQILNGRWGPYIKIGSENFKIPKEIDPKSLSLKECFEVAKNQKNKKKGAKKNNRKK